MDDLISRQAAIAYSISGMTREIDGDKWIRVSEVRESIKTMPSAQPDWIPVTERLPEEGHDVLITKESFKIKGYEQRVIKAKRSVDPRSGKIEWWSPEFGTLTNNAVLAWMPLPEPWRGE